MYYSAIKYVDIANGLGCRTVLFVSGCRNKCEGCFQPNTWNFKNGEEFTKEVQQNIIESLKPNYVSGLTLLGGDPFEEENQEGLIPLVREFKEKYPNKSIWAYTGYILDKDLIEGGKKYTKYTKELLESIDVLVDGPFVLDEKDITLKFKGSKNQRIIDMKATIESKKIKLLDL